MLARSIGLLSETFYSRVRLYDGMCGLRCLQPDRLRANFGRGISNQLDIRFGAQTILQAWQPAGMHEDGCTQEIYRRDVVMLTF